MECHDEQPTESTMVDGEISPTQSARQQFDAYAPLRQPVFRQLWIASVASNVGTWIQNVGAAWLMTELSPSPLWVALIQAAGMLPVFFLGLPAGALADIVDRRQLLLFSQSWMLVAAGLLAGLSATGMMTPLLLLLLTGAMGVGLALNAPAWQSVIAELVPREQLPAAVTLNSVSMNASRAVGPALGGVIVAAAGSEAAFLLNALSFVGVLIVLFRWQRVSVRTGFPPEHMFGAMRIGLGYVRHTAAVRAILIRAAAYVSGAAGLWALLPASVRNFKDFGPGTYGLLLGSLGFGAVAGTFVLPKLRSRWGNSRILIMATLMFAAGTLIVATTTLLWLWAEILIPAGAGWLAGLTTLSSAVQTLVPGWVRSRAIAVYLLVFYGSMTLGSILWGLVAQNIGVGPALACAAAWMGVGLLAAFRYRVPEGNVPAPEHSHHWPDAPPLKHWNSEEGPVLVLVEYQIDPARGLEFRRATDLVNAIRRRDGAYWWELFEDVEKPGRYIESFLVSSWNDHLRQHDRVLESDKPLEAAVRAFHIGSEPPKVTHLIAADARLRSTAIEPESPT